MGLEPASNTSVISQPPRRAAAAQLTHACTGGEKPMGGAWPYPPQSAGASFHRGRPPLQDPADRQGAQQSLAGRRGESAIDFACSVARETGSTST